MQFASFFSLVGHRLDSFRYICNHFTDLWGLRFSTHSKNAKIIRVKLVKFGEYFIAYHDRFARYGCQFLKLYVMFIICGSCLRSTPSNSFCNFSVIKPVFNAKSSAHLRKFSYPLPLIVPYRKKRPTFLVCLIFANQGCLRLISDSSNKIMSKLGSYDI